PFHHALFTNSLGLIYRTPKRPKRNHTEKLSLY
ncbi:MAG: hypothetical protein ACI9CO_002048, partial [Candidatus Azotimanducaceae bacterium]